MKEVVQLTPDDDAALRAGAHLKRVAFGGDGEGVEDGIERYRRDAEQCVVLAVRDAGEVLGVTTLRPYTQWYAGREVPMIGLGGVAVAAHARRRGVATTLLGAAIDRMREEGAAVSTLYPSNPPVYRVSGWEIAGVVAGVDLPTIGMPAGAPGQVALRALDRAAPDPGDLAAVQALYTAAARDAIGPLTRTGVLFDITKLAELDAVVIASVDGVDAGYVSWRRNGSKLDVPDLIADRPIVRDTLLSCVGSWQTTIDTARVRFGDPAVAGFGLPRGAVIKNEPWMLRVVDAPASIAARGFQGPDGEVDLVLTDPQAPWQEGHWRLSVDGGVGTLTRGGNGDVHLHTRGLAALFTGYAGASPLARAGLASGNEKALFRLVGLFSGPTPWMLDEF